MQRIIAIGDIHGHPRALENLLCKVGYSCRDDQLVLLGDYIDRGPDSRGAVALVRDLVQDGAVALCGNHEDMGLFATGLRHRDMYHRNDPYHNGFGGTIKSYGLDRWDTRNEKMNSDLRFLGKLPFKHEIGKYRFTHAGVGAEFSFAKQEEEELLWDRNFVFLNYKKANWMHEDHRKHFYIFGHTTMQSMQEMIVDLKRLGTKEFGKFVVRDDKDVAYIDEGRVCIDGGLYKGGVLTALILPELEFVCVEG